MEKGLYSDRNLLHTEQHIQFFKDIKILKWSEIRFNEGQNLWHNIKQLRCFFKLAAHELNQTSEIELLFWTAAFLISLYPEMFFLKPADTADNNV